MEGDAVDFDEGDEYLVDRAVRVRVGDDGDFVLREDDHGEEDSTGGS